MSLEVRKGYKQTEVGVIPEDWEVRALFEVAEILVGGDLKENCFSQHYNRDFAFPVYSNTVENKGLYGFYNFEEFYGESVTVVGRGVGLGTAFPRTGGFGAIGRLLILKPFEKLHAYFLSEYINHRLRVFEESSGIPQLTGVQVAKYKVAVPPLHEQEAIAAALSDVDALLTALDALIAKKRLIKQGAMQELLTGKKRLPGFSGEWDSPKIGDLFIFKNGLNKAKEFFGYGTPIVNYMDVYGKRWIYSNDLRGRVSLSGDEVRAFEVRKGDVFFTRTSETAAEVGISSVMLDQPHDTVFSGFILRARPKDNSLDDQFKKFCFSTDAVRKQITSQSTETTRALTSGRSLSIVAIARPPLEEQRVIAELLNDMDAEIAALEQRREKTRQLKQGMMQELLTGKTRLV